MKKILLPVISLLFTSIGVKAQITKLQDFENKKSATIGIFQGITFRESGFSGLYPIPNTNGMEFWTVSDRGVNVDAKNANTARSRPWPAPGARPAAEGEKIGRLFPPRRGCPGQGFSFEGERLARWERCR